MRATRVIVGMAACAVVWAHFTVAAEQIGTAFTYQGQLKQDGVPITGAADFEFHLWDAETGGVQFATVTSYGVALTNGLFTVDVDFGPDMFDGSARWLEIRVAVPSGGAFTPLTGRQPVTPAPYALALPGLRAQQNDISPNLIGGYRGNTVTVDVTGATIGGGGSDGMTNRVTDQAGAIGGGEDNQAGDGTGTVADAAYATVGGGDGNSALGPKSTIGGGRDNTASGINSTVGGGYNNNASDSNSTVAGGANNVASGSQSTVSGGSANTASGDMSTVGGGKYNTANGYFATIPGGSLNEASGSYSFAAGQRAQANHAGAFVWSDSTTTDPDFFYSTGANQFLIKATGGVGINTNAPSAALHIGGTAGVDGLMFPDGTLQKTAATGGGAGDGHSLDAIDGSPTDAVYVEASGKVRMNKGGLTIFDDAGHGISMTSDTFSFNEGSSEDPVYGYSSATDMHTFYTNGNGQMVISAAGNVGIGMGFSQSPAAKLHIGGTDGVDGIMFPDGSLQMTAATGGSGDCVWSESGSGIHYNSGNVGIGTPNPPTSLRLWVLGDTQQGIKSETTADDGWALWGVATAASSNTIGVNGTAADSSDGIGVYGWGGNTGVKGESTSSSGWTYGVWGKVNSPGGTGVYGKHDADSGTGPGVYGITDSEDEWSAGVNGYASSTAISNDNDKTIGVSGFSQGGDGIGVYGQAMHSTTNHPTYGGYFESVSNFGTGVYGEATHTSGINYGVRGVSPSPNGYGGYFKNTSSDGTALYAESEGAGAGDATLRVKNTEPIAGMAAYFTSVGSYATMHAQNNGTGEVLWLSKDNAEGEFIVAHNEVTGRRVFTVDHDGWTKVSVLEITGGADLSEQFDVSGQAEQVEPGMVVAIDAENPGKLVVANRPYDYTVAGVVSGAGGVKPGMLMGQTGTIADGKHPIALTGRVWTWCDSSPGEIKPGDLLTTSSVPGHAMKVTDRTRAQGAIIGKAMTSLSEGTGLVLVLVSLQ